MNLHHGLDASLVNRIIGHLLKLDEADSRRKAESQGTLAIFKHICHLLDLDISDIELEGRNPKQILFQHLADKVRLYFMIMIPYVDGHPLDRERSRCIL